MSYFGRPAIVFATLILVCALLSTAWLTLDKIRSDARQEAGKALTTVLDTTHQAIATWVEVNKRDTRIWAESKEVVEYAKELLAIPSSKESLLNASGQSKLRNWLRPVHTGRGFRGFFIIGPGNISLASTRDNNVGTINLLVNRGDFLNAIWNGETGMSAPMPSDVPLPDGKGNIIENYPTMFIAAPIKDERGKVIAVLAFRIDPAEGFTDVLQRGRIGESGETYAFDRKGRLISESRFDETLREIGLIGSGQKGILHVEIRDPGVDLTKGQSSTLPRKQQPLTYMAASATAGLPGKNLDGYRDYRGVLVIGVWLWDSKLGLGITTEIDVKEIYEFQRTSRAIFLIFTVIAIASLITLIVVSERSWRKILQRDQQVILANRAKSDLLANMGHELRTPLNAIIGFSSAMKAEVFGSLGSPRYRDYLDDIHYSGEHLLRIINDILDVSAIEAESLELKESSVNIYATVDASTRLISSRAQRTKVSINREIETDLPLIYADEGRVKQVLTNLLSNAVKFTPDGGEITVRARQNKNGSMDVSVSDTGIGMDQADIETAMSNFGQVDSGLNRKHDGTGLGLSLVKGVMDMHGGTMEISSQKNKGTTVTVSFPRERVLREATVDHENLGA